MSEFTPITTQEELDAVIGERLKRERDTVTKRYEEKYAGYVSGADHEAALAELQKQVDDAAKKQSDSQALIDGLNAKVRGYETNSVKMRVAQELGLPHELAERLSGDDEDAIRKDAEALAKIVGAQQKKYPPAAKTEPNKELSGKSAAYYELLQSMKDQEG